MIFASTPSTGSAAHKGPGKYLAAGVGWGRQHEANPILVDIRKFREVRSTVRWESILARFDLALRYGYYVSNDWERFDADGEFVRHARRVLTRLARLEVQ